MSLVINHNKMASNVANSLNAHYARLSTSTQRLASGLRINSAADDAAGLAIRELQRADIASLQQGARNANDAISLIQTADGALSVIDEKLIRMKELAEQAATGTYDSTQRMMIESEYQQMASEITRIANATDFNGIHLLDGTLGGAHDGSGLTASGKMKIHFGTGNDSAEDYYYIEIGNCTAAALGLGNTALATTEYSTEYYENLRNASAQAAYDLTYNQKYEDFFKPVYDKLVAGTSQQAPLDAATARAQADAMASKLASAYAEDDKKMAAAAMDKVYNDNYRDPYLATYQKYRAAGMSDAQAQAAADKVAAAKALESVMAANNSVAASNDVSAYTNAPANALPPKNSSGVAALLDESRTLVYDAAYKDIYDGLYQDAVNKALADTSIVGMDPSSHPTATVPSDPKLTDAQVLAIHKAVDAQAASQAAAVADEASTTMTNIYQTTYGDTTSGRFKTYYDAALSDGYPASVAEKIAEEKASADAWDAVEAALRSGNFSLEDGDFTTATDINVPTTLPTWEQIDALTSEIGTAVETDIFNYFSGKIYSEIYAAVSIDGDVNPAIPTPLQPTEAQRNQMLALANSTAQSIASDVGTQISNAVKAVYRQAYPSPTTTAQDAWNAVKNALADALDGTAFGITGGGAPCKDSDATDGLTGHTIAPTQFKYDLPSMTINTAGDIGTKAINLNITYGGSAADVENAYKAANAAGVARLNTPLASTQTIRINASKTGGATDVTEVSNTAKNNAATWLDDKHALNAGDPAMVAACKSFVDRYAASRNELRPGGTISTQEAAQLALTAINAAIVSKDNIRAHLGATQNRLENTITNLVTQAENLQNAESRISDVDVATEMTEFVRQQILTQSAVAMLAQANSLPKMAMQIIGG